ncbi:MAG: VanZ family protein [Anaerolineae bacterium]
MAGIFYFSSRPDPLKFVDRSVADRDALGLVAHVVEYAGLAAWLYRALAVGEGKVKPYLGAGFLSVAYAVSDELHQMGVPGREASLGDVALDALGAAVALGLVGLWSKRSASARPLVVSPSQVEGLRGKVGHTPEPPLTAEADCRSCDLSRRRRPTHALRCRHRRCLVGRALGRGTPGPRRPGGPCLR